jgi:hypothetical protein
VELESKSTQEEQNNQDQETELTLEDLDQVSGGGLKSIVDAHNNSYDF